MKTITRFNPAHKSQYPKSFKALKWILEKSIAVSPSEKAFHGKLPAFMISDIAVFNTIGYAISDMAFEMYWDSEGRRNIIKGQFEDSDTIERKFKLVWSIE